MKLRDAIKTAKRGGLPQSRDEFAAALDRAARSITGRGPGHPTYEAIVHPPQRGRRVAGDAEPMEQVAVRIPAAVIARIRRKAKADRLTVSDELRMAITAYAAQP